MDFLHCCSYANRILVDYEDRGWVHLLDMDYVECVAGDGTKVVHVNNCFLCEEACLHEEHSLTRVNYYSTERFLNEIKKSDGDTDSEE